MDIIHLLIKHEPENQNRSSRPKLFLYILIFSLIFTFVGLFVREWYLASTTSPEEWDTIIFSQQWPSTYCQQWEEKSPSHSCRLPPPGQYAWTIHGLWPTKLGTTGPLFCDPSIKFNKEALSNIQSDLNKQWLDIQSGSDPYKFWKHEWDKHGTCAISDKSLSNELAYFKQGLKWNSEYPIGSILAEHEIVPGPSDESTYTIYQYWNALTSSLQKKPYITCIKDKRNHKFYISEVRICFDKLLNLIDCGGVGSVDNTGMDKDEDSTREITTTPQTNCPANDPIIYRT